MLKLAGETDIGLERFEQLKFNPGERVTPDLEAGTSTITASAKGGSQTIVQHLLYSSPMMLE